MANFGSIENLTMKKLLFPVLAIFFFACDKGPSPESLAIEKATLNCWNENWVETKGYDISKGITLLDDHLASRGLLGKRTVEDYKKFFNDTTVIYISDSVKGSSEMATALNSEFAGNPDIEGMIKCWDINWFKKMSTLDSTDVMRRLGVLVQRLSASGGDPDFKKTIDEFFAGMTEKDLERPFVKDIMYFVFWKTRDQQTHIKFRHPDSMSDEPVTPVN
jgi:hypothetical protein